MAQTDERQQHRGTAGSPVDLRRDRPAPGAGGPLASPPGPGEGGGSSQPGHRQQPRADSGGEKSEGGLPEGGSTADPPAEPTPPGDRLDRFSGLPVVVIRYPDGTTRPAPFLMSREDVAAFFRLHDSRTSFPEKTLQRYRRMGLSSVRIGRRVWFRLDDVLRFLDQQQSRLG